MSCVASVIALMPSIIAGLLRHRQCRRRGVAPSGTTHYTNAPTNGPATILGSICRLPSFQASAWFVADSPLEEAVRSEPEVEGAGVGDVKFSDNVSREPAWSSSPPPGAAWTPTSSASPLQGRQKFCEPDRPAGGAAAVVVGPRDRLPLG